MRAGRFGRPRAVVRIRARCPTFPEKPRVGVDAFDPANILRLPIMCPITNPIRTTPVTAMTIFLPMTVSQRAVNRRANGDVTDGGA